MADQPPGLVTVSDDSTVGAPRVFLRPAGSSDEAVRQRIFAESHCAGFELLGLEPAALAELISLQFRARLAQYRTLPGAAEYLICHGAGAAPVGSCWVSDTADQLRVLDLAVLVEHRRHGVAREVLTGLCARAAAAGKPVRLSVWQENQPARNLYQALGFRADPRVAVDDGEPGDLGNGYLELVRPFPSVPARPRAGVR